MRLNYRLLDQVQYRFSRKVPGSIPGVAGDFSRGIWQLHVPWDRLSL